MKKIISLIAILAITQAGCITYFRADKVKPYQPETQKTTVLNYRIIGSEGDRRAIEKVLIARSGFNDVIRSDVEPSQGAYVKVEMNKVHFSPVAATFGYLSYVTLTFLPSWSTNEGYELVYSIYKDGQKIKQYTYEVKRTLFIWIVVLPVFWISFIKNSEAEAFTFTTDQFLIDSATVLKSL